MPDYLAWDGREYYEVKSDEALEPLSILVVDEKQLKSEGVKGGPGSGNFGHAGRTGKVGGSAPGKGGGRQSQSYYQASAENVKKARDHGRARLEKTAKRHKTTTDEVERKISETVSTAVEENPIAIQVSPYALEQILEDGQFRNQFETGTSGGYFDIDHRRERERAGLGIPDGADAAERPVYGWIRTSENLGAAADYGDISVVLKEGVKDRSTVTVGDSLDTFGMGTMVGVPSKRIGIEGFDDQVEALYREGLSGVQYIETQIKGGVRLSDIAEIQFPTHYRDDPEEWAYIQHSLDQAGVQYSFLKWRYLR